MSDLNFPNRKDPKLLAAALLIGLVLVAGIVLIGVRLLNGGDDASPQQPTATATGKTPDSSSACGLPDGNQTVPTKAPATNWELSGKMAAPRSQTYGPAKEHAGVHSCFARNANGALFAAVTFYSDAFALGDKLGREFIDRWYKEGSAKNAALTALNNSDDSGLSPIPQQMAGFRVDSYTPGRVTVTLVTRETDGPAAGGLRAFPLTVVWAGGDWKVDLDTTAPPAAGRIPSLEGFLNWSGVA
jgi:hypothetical protein